MTFLWIAALCVLRFSIVSGQGYKLNALEDNAKEQARLSQQAPNPAAMTGQSLLRGGNNQPEGTMAPGTNMFVQAHQGWIPKLPQKKWGDRSTENLEAAESLTGKGFMSLPDNMQGNSGLQTPGGNPMTRFTLSNDPSKMKFPLRL